ncbi:rhamnose transport system substrate-binding protein [Herbaspirillum sp. Sphag1AN]|uniref:rhamnose ABC transporter substrate-binding protein n=1 Tax=unclassified Herbaspirillum TaxID=2624150 RepID=UPI00181DAC42|nr:MULTISPECIES: rhamnose ABC transporter substrate-binding protein [unclassified Herbaspirillum]MBB3212493.1 rhamnose transport system substrate-binding protein [Herbaspirillum sp. Sphag1AN]MBB3245408.1 rhamnose transport system substrate-binding protein [Herbaspirillum sp. Sphag64]
MIRRTAATAALRAGIATLLVATFGWTLPAIAADKVRIAMVVKSLGNGFFDAAHEGAKEAAQQLGDVEIIYTGPTTPTAEGQIEIINSLISQKVDAIVISANDANALVPITKKAMQRGIKVVSFDSGIARQGRLMQLNPSNAELIGRKQIQMASEAIGGSGDVAILSATAQATNQNIWIGEMKKALAKPEFAKIKLVATVYGDDQSDKSYREAIGLLRSYPNLKAIIAPTTVGINAAGKAVVDEKLVGKVYVTGLGLPSEMAGHVKSGAVKSFAIWNPIDLGYASTYAAYEFVKGRAQGKPGETIAVGRMGSIKLDDSGEAALAPPFTYDASNVDKFAKIF